MQAEAALYGRREVAAARYAISAVFFVNGAIIGGWMPYLPYLQERLGIDKAVLGNALFCSALGSVLTMPFAGPMIHRFGSRSMALASGFLLCLTVPVLLVLPALPAFAAALFVYGAFNGQMDVCMNAHSVAVQNRYNRPILSAVHGWFSLGGFAGGAGTALSIKLDIAPGTHLVAASVVLASVLVASYRFLLPTSVDAQSEGPKFAVPKGILLLLGILVLFSFVSESSMWNWSAVYLKDVLQTNASMAAVGCSVFSGAMAVGRFSGDSLIARFGRVRVIFVSGLLSAAGLGLALAIHNPFVAIAGFACVGFGIGNEVPILFRAAGNVPGVSAGAGLAAVTTCGYSGFLFAPAAVGRIAQARSLAFALGLLAALCLAVAIAGPPTIAKLESAE